MSESLLVTAWLRSPLAGEPPQLDALLEWALAPREPAKKPQAGVPRYQVDRLYTAPPLGAIAIPLLRVRVGPWLVACSSDPILPAAASDSSAHIAKRIAASRALLLAREERRVISTTASWTKSYRLPLRQRALPCVRWFARGDRRELLHALGSVAAIGKKVAVGFGQVEAWTVEPSALDCCWFAPHEDGTSVLMRTLPWQIHGRPWLPDRLVGYRRHFGACCPPYWHHERFTEVVLPC